MIDISTLITRLQTTTTYTITNARAKEPDLTDAVNLPIIYIGYSTVISKNPTASIEHDIFNMNGEDLVQGFDIQIVCKQTDLVTIWKNVYKNLIGYNPLAIEYNHSGLTYVQGGVIGVSNDNLWWLDRWHLGFPTVTPI
jgi:hypothetical protein